MKTLAIDLETRSSVDLAKAGVYRYCEAEDFAILLFACSADDGEVMLFDLTAAFGEGHEPGAEDFRRWFAQSYVPYTRYPALIPFRGTALRFILRERKDS